MPKPLTMWITTNWKILLKKAEKKRKKKEKKKKIEIPDHLTCLLRNLYAGQEVTVRTRHETMDWFHIGKGVHQSCILLPCLFNFYAVYTMQNAGLDESQAGIKIARKLSRTTSDMQMTPH